MIPSQPWEARFSALDSRAILKETALQHRYEISLYKVIKKWVTGKKFLEAGSGSGRITIALAKDDRSCEAIGVDLLDEAVEISRQGARLQKVQNAQFVQGDIFLLWTMFPGKQFDTVFSVGVQEHFTPVDGEKLLTLLKEKVKPGGTLIISVPNAKSPVYRLWKRVAGPNLVYRFGLERDVYAQEIIDIFKKLGLTIIEVGGTDPVYGLRKIYKVEENTGIAYPVWWSIYANILARVLAPIVDLLDYCLQGYITRNYGFDFIVKGICK